MERLQNDGTAQLWGDNTVAGAIAAILEQRRTEHAQFRDNQLKTTNDANEAAVTVVFSLSYCVRLSDLGSQKLSKSRIENAIERK